MDKKVEGLIVILLLVLVMFVVRAEITGNVILQPDECKQKYPNCNIVGNNCCEEVEGQCPNLISCGQTDDKKDTSSFGGDGDLGTGGDGGFGSLEEDVDPFRDIFDEGTTESGDTKGGLFELQKTLGKGIPVVEDIKGVEIKYPQGIIKNTNEGDWGFTSWFSEIDGVKGITLKMSGQMNCDKNSGKCVIGWFDYYSAAGCELNVLGAELQFDTKKKEAEVIDGKCEWYYNKGEKEKAEIKKLFEVPRSSIPELSKIYGRIVKGIVDQPTEFSGNLNFCEDYKIKVTRCWGTLETDEVWPYSNSVKGIIHLDYTTSITLVNKFSKKVNTIEIEPRKDEKIAFEAINNRPVRAPEKKGVPPGLYVGSGAVAIVLGLAWGLNAYQKSLVAKGLASKAAASSGSV